MNIDKDRLRAEICALAGECRAVKAVLGTTWTRPMADEQRKLARLRRKATELCVLAAHLRGKTHVRRPQGTKTDEERAAWQLAVATRVAKDYRLPEVAVSA
ncbi:MAG: hypothetical protein JST00_31030 [Deltaproteobacteria bacterium]|nr:hypothetical protein [Deltaproteobacteria bacterium]